MSGLCLEYPPIEITALRKVAGERIQPVSEDYSKVFGVQTSDFGSVPEKEAESPLKRMQRRQTTMILCSEILRLGKWPDLMVWSWNAGSVFFFFFFPYRWHLGTFKGQHNKNQPPRSNSLMTSRLFISGRGTLLAVA